MSQSHISSTMREAVAERSKYRCSYCLTPENITGALLTIDHIVPEAKGGATTLDNLCLACWGCNLIKQARLTAIDPLTGDKVRLFHPHLQSWQQHFAWDAGGLLILGLTPTGRATVNALRLNRPPLVNARRLWIEAGWHPPKNLA